MCSIPLPHVLDTGPGSVEMASDRQHRTTDVNQDVIERNNHSAPSTNAMENDIDSLSQPNSWIKLGKEVSRMIDRSFCILTCLCVPHRTSARYKILLLTYLLERKQISISSLLRRMQTILSHNNPRTLLLRASRRVAPTDRSLRETPWFEKQAGQ